MHLLEGLIAPWMIPEAEEPVMPQQEEVECNKWFDAFRPFIADAIFLTAFACIGGFALSHTRKILKKDSVLYVPDVVYNSYSPEAGSSKQDLVRKIIKGIMDPSRDLLKFNLDKITADVNRIPHEAGKNDPNHWWKKHNLENPAVVTSEGLKYLMELHTTHHDVVADPDIAMSALDEFNKGGKLVKAADWLRLIQKGEVLPKRMTQLCTNILDWYIWHVGTEEQQKLVEEDRKKDYPQSHSPHVLVTLTAPGSKSTPLTTVALVDTGANRCTSPRVIPEIMGCKLAKPGAPELKGVGKTNLKGKVDMSLNINGNKWGKSEVDVADDNNVPLLIGMSKLREMGVAIDLRRQCLEYINNEGTLVNVPFLTPIEQNAFAHQKGA